MNDEHDYGDANIRFIPKAVYHSQELPDYRGNPLIEALGPIYEPEEAYEHLCYFPMYNEHERELSLGLRYNALYRLQHFFQPIAQHLDLERRFARLIRSGYLSRNPLDPKQVQELTGMARSGHSSTASSFTLMGFSGIGKTTAIERILSLYPQCILHEHPINRIQIVWLKLNCPHDGSLKSLCIDFFAKIDDLIGTNYLQKFGNGRYSLATMVPQMGRLARLHSIGALIIDEIQHLLTAKDKASDIMMNFFVTLINEIGIPVILIGTMRTKLLLQQDFRQARRGSDQGDMVWEQMKPGEDWDLFIDEMWKYQWTKKKVLLTDAIRTALYDQSQGIIDIAVKLYFLSQGRAIETGRETITSALIEQVAREDLKLVQPMLAALRSGTLSDLDKYGDILPMDLAAHLQHRQSKIDLKATIAKKKEEQEKSHKENQYTITEKAIHSLITLDIDPKIAEKFVRQALDSNINMTLAEIVSYVLRKIDEPKHDIRVVSKNQPKENVLNDIIQAGKKYELSAYEALLKDGYILDPIQYFAI